MNFLTLPFQGVEVLQRIGDSEAQDALASLVDRNLHSCKAAQALVRLNDPRGKSALVSLLSDSKVSLYQRSEALNVLEKTGWAPASPPEIVARCVARGEWKQLCELSTMQDTAELATTTLATVPPLLSPQEKLALSVDLEAFGNPLAAELLLELTRNSELSDEAVKSLTRLLERDPTTTRLADLEVIASISNVQRSWTTRHWGGSGSGEYSETHNNVDDVDCSALRRLAKQELERRIKLSTNQDLPPF